MTHAFGCSGTDGDTQTLCQLLAFSMVWPLATKSSPVPLSKLSIGMECAGSVGFSGRQLNRTRDAV